MPNNRKSICNCCIISLISVFTACVIIIITFGFGIGISNILYTGSYNMSTGTPINSNYTSNLLCYNTPTAYGYCGVPYGMIVWSVILFLSILTTAKIYGFTYLYINCINPIDDGISKPLLHARISELSIQKKNPCIRLSDRIEVFV